MTSKASDKIVVDQKTSNPRLCDSISPNVGRPKDHRRTENRGTDEQRNRGTEEQKNRTENIEQKNRGTEEQQNGRTAEQQNRGTVEL